MNDLQLSERIAKLEKINPVEIGCRAGELLSILLELRERRSKTAAEEALDKIAALCGCPSWDYPGQVVRDVETAVKVASTKRQ